VRLFVTTSMCKISFRGFSNNALSFPGQGIIENISLQRLFVNGLKSESV
jgi:hypothetical protein